MKSYPGYISMLSFTKFLSIYPSLCPHALPNFTLPTLRPLKPIGMRLEVHHSLIDLGLARGDKRSVLHNRLVQRLPGDQDESGLFAGAIFDGRSDKVAFLLEHDVVVGRDGVAALGSV